MQKTLSIIIPIYNVETYLEQCLKSVVCQLDEGMESLVEVILVDDGSTDRSPTGMHRAGRGCRSFTGQMREWPRRAIPESNSHRENGCILWIPMTGWQTTGSPCCWQE